MGYFRDDKAWEPVFPLFATPFAEGESRLPPETPPAPAWDLVVLNFRQSYSGPWYAHQVWSVDRKFKQISVAYDPQTYELKLYDLPNQLGSDANIEEHVVARLPVARYRDEALGATMFDLLEKTFGEALLQMVFETLVRYPSTRFAIKYTGHGSPYMSFEQITYDNQKGFFGGVVDLRQQKIDFLDWSTNCNASSLYNLLVQAPYARYVLADDLLYGSAWDINTCGINSMDRDRCPEQNPAFDYQSFLVTEEPLEAQLRKYIRAFDAFWNGKCAKECYEKTTESTVQVSLIDGPAFMALANHVDLTPLLSRAGQSTVSAAASYRDGATELGDLRTHLAEHHADAVPLFDAAILERANNRASIPWSIPAQGVNFMKQ